MLKAIKANKTAQSLFLHGKNKLLNFSSKRCASSTPNPQPTARAPSSLRSYFSPGKIMLGSFAAFTIWFYFRHSYDEKNPPTKNKLPPTTQISTTHTTNAPSSRITASSSLLLSTEFVPESAKDKKFLIEVVVGDVTAETSEAIVNSADRYLAFLSGMPHAFLIKGGNALANEAREYVKQHGAVEYTKVVPLKCTGDLKCAYLLNAVPPVWNGGKVFEHVDIEQTISNCLRKADELGLKTVSIPALRIGHLETPVEVAADATFKGVLGYLNKNAPKSQIQTIRLINADIRVADEFKLAMEKHIPSSKKPQQPAAIKPQQQPAATATTPNAKQ